jgi:hypothetical protein
MLTENVCFRSTIKLKRLAQWIKVLEGMVEDIRRRPELTHQKHTQQQVPLSTMMSIAAFKLKRI